MNRLCADFPKAENLPMRDTVLKQELYSDELDRIVLSLSLLKAESNDKNRENGAKGHRKKRCFEIFYLAFYQTPLYNDYNKNGGACRGRLRGSNQTSTL